MTMYSSVLHDSVFCNKTKWESTSLSDIYNATTSLSCKRSVCDPLKLKMTPKVNYLGVTMTPENYFEGKTLLLQKVWGLWWEQNFVYIDEGFAMNWIRPKFLSILLTGNSDIGVTERGSLKQYSLFLGCA